MKKMSLIGDIEFMLEYLDLKSIREIKRDIEKKLDEKKLKVNINYQGIQYGGN